MARKSEPSAIIKKSSAGGALVVHKDGRVSVSFDFTKIPVPKETYSASQAFLKEGPGHDVFLIFSQVDGSTSEPQHYLQVKFDDIGLLNTWINSREFFQRLGLWYESTYGAKPALQPVEVTRGLDSFQMAANLAFMGHFESTAVAAFYYLDPRSTRQMAIGQLPGRQELVTPVVQVKLNTLVLWNLLAQMEQYIEKLVERHSLLRSRLVQATVSDQKQLSEGGRNG